MPGDGGAAEAAALAGEADFGPHRYCVPCNVRWRGDGSCFVCDAPGVLCEITDPPGWPQLSVPTTVLPGQAA